MRRAVHIQITTICLDIAKNVFQVNGIGASEKVIVRKQLRRGQVMAFFEALAPCLIGTEACAASHHWARELTKLGHEVRLMPAKDVKAYIKPNKNDAADAEVICEAVRRPTLRFVLDAASISRSAAAPTDPAGQCVTGAFGRVRRYAAQGRERTRSSWQSSRGNRFALAG